MNQTDKHIEILKALGYQSKGDAQSGFIIENPGGATITDDLWDTEEEAWEYASGIFNDLNAAFECRKRARKWGFTLDLTEKHGDYWIALFERFDQTYKGKSNAPAAAIAEAFWNLLQERKQ